MNLRWESCESRFGLFDDQSLDMIIADIPFTASKMAGGESAILGFADHADIKREFGKWDFDYSPLELIENAYRTLRPGGWLVIKNGDKLFGQARDFAERDPENLKNYIEFLYRLGVIERYPPGALEFAESIGLLSRFKYKATIAWHKTNPAASVRKSGFRSSMEWLQVMLRLNDDGSVPQPVSWNFLDQSEMKNWLEGPPVEDDIVGPRCQGNQRLYWHVLQPVYRDPEDEASIVGGHIIPCKDPSSCGLCKSTTEKRRYHPTQTPLYVWRWVYDRLGGPGIKAYDPYAGVMTSGIAAPPEIDWQGSEINWEFATVGNMWAAGMWEIPAAAGELQVMELF